MDGALRQVIDSAGFSQCPLMPFLFRPASPQQMLPYPDAEAHLMNLLLQALPADCAVSSRDGFLHCGGAFEPAALPQSQRPKPAAGKRFSEWLQYFLFPAITPGKSCRRSTWIPHPRAVRLHNRALSDDGEAPLLIPCRFFFCQQSAGYWHPGARGGYRSAGNRGRSVRYCQ